MGKITGTGMGWRELYLYLDAMRYEPMGNPGLAKVTGDLNIEAVNEIDYMIDGTIYTLAAGTDVDDGAAQRAQANYWNVMLVSADTSLALDGTWGAGTIGWASEAEAVAHMPDIPASQCAIGYVALRAKSSAVFISGTDDYAGGDAGNVAQTTTCYNRLDLKTLDLI